MTDHDSSCDTTRPSWPALLDDVGETSTGGRGSTNQPIVRGPAHLNSNEAHLGIYELKLAASVAIFLRYLSIAQVSPSPLRSLVRRGSRDIRRKTSLSTCHRRATLSFHERFHHERESFIIVQRNDNRRIIDNEWSPLSFSLSLTLCFSRMSIELLRFIIERRFVANLSIVALLL